MKPLFLLDVDGVLNAVNLLSELRAMEQGTGWPDWQEGDADGGRRVFHIVWSPTLVRRITAIHEEGLAEIRWLTTWEERAQQHIAPLLGLPHFELAGKRDLAAEARRQQGAIGTPGDYWWKLPLAQRALATSPERAFVWADDDLPGVPEASQWARQRWESDRRAKACLVSPQFDLGISPKQMDAIEAFLRGELDKLHG